MTRQPRAIAWTTDEINSLEDSLADMSYSDAVLFLTVDLDVSLLVATPWLAMLAKQKPHSRLGTHYRFSKAWVGELWT